MIAGIKRAYEPPSPSDGTRVLVDRLWPRGVRKESIDLWMKEVAPSAGLRKWFSHDPAKWSEFLKRYFRELDSSGAADELRKLAKRERVTLVYGAKDEEHNQAVALLKYLRKK